MEWGSLVVKEVRVLVPGGRPGGLPGGGATMVGSFLEMVGRAARN